MSTKGYVAFDLGAESGRAILATLSGDRLEIHEVHRFLNVPVSLPSGLAWNFTGLYLNLLEGLKKAHVAATERGVKLVALGVDTWGVDCGLLGSNGQLLNLPMAYRNARNKPAYDKTLKQLGRKAIYRATGIQFMPFNTLYQLVAMRDLEPEALAAAKTLLFVPDLLHYSFTGKAVTEATIASTSQMVDPRKRNGAWTTGLLKKLDLPTAILPRIVPAGTRIGKLRKEVAAELGVPVIDVITPGSHDTASAVAAVPVDQRKTTNWAYLSSGTWSLMGAELDKPLITPESEAVSFTNERGVGDKIRFLKNIAGLWLVQETRRDLAKKGQEIGYAALTDLAAKSQPFRTMLDPNHELFIMPGDMIAKLAAFAKKTKQPVPQTPGQMVRACLESLAFSYRRTLGMLEGLLGKRMEVLHIVGGGGQSKLLNQMTADAIGRTVIVGPFEATAIGNALTQAIGAGQVKDLAHLRAIVRNSFDLLTYKPANTAAYDAQYARSERLLGK